MDGTAPAKIHQRAKSPALAMLFRQEVIAHQRTRAWGEIVIPQAVPLWVATAILTLVAVGIVILLAIATYDRKQSVSGYVTPMGGVSQIYATKPGVVARLFVDEGTKVQRGTPLVEVTVETVGSNGGLSVQLLTQIERRLQEISRQIEAVSTRYSTEEKRLEQRIRGTEAELTALQQRLAVERAQWRLAEDDMERLSGLTNAGHASRNDQSQREQQALAREAIVRETERQIVLRDSDLQDARLALQQLPPDLAERLSQLRVQAAELEATKVELDTLDTYFITAPVDGTIVAMQIGHGQAVPTNIPLIALVSTDAALEVQLLVPSRSVGLLRPGQEVRMRVDAYPFQRYGLVSGYVQSISRSAYRPEEMLGPLIPEETVYRVSVSMQASKVFAYGQERPLLPGMTLQADIVVDRRNFLDLVIDPVRAVLRS